MGIEALPGGSLVAARTGLDPSAAKRIEVKPLRGVALLELTATAPSSEDAIALVEASLEVVKDHLGAGAEVEVAETPGGER